MQLDDTAADESVALAPTSGIAAPRRVAGPARRETPASDDLPPELAFLVAQGVDAALLRRAARIAERVGVSGEAALLGLGFPDDRYYRLLARHLGAVHLDRPLPLSRVGVDREACRAAGLAPLAPNRGNLSLVLAPDREGLGLLLNQHRFQDRGGYGCAITTPHRLDALLRRHDEAGLCERVASGLADWDAALSARGGATGRQRAAALGVATALAFGLGSRPELVGTISSVLLFLLFAAVVAQRLAVTAASATGLAGETASRAPRASDRDLPVYTLLVPLFREAAVLPQLVRDLDAIDYPASKLDIKIILESSDAATIAAAARLRLPARYHVMVLPPGHPQTKPRALNAGLDAARGALVVVYDAEDRPDPGQLRAAAARFARGAPELACLQARLTIDHADETWVTRMFALDYAALFHAVKPGLAALGLPVPLGGTSNHFRAAALRRVAGWDAWNVTEDIDLGYRLARFGHAVGSLDSDTFEEAPLTLGRWLPQRSRWLKGWMVTAIVHGRDPARLVADLGWRSALWMAVSLAGTIMSCLVGPPLILLLGLQGCREALFRPETPLWWVSVPASAALLGCGGAAVVWPIVAGLRRMGRLDLVVWIVTLPLYFLLISVACWRALYELWRDPQAWNKTEHGLARRRTPGRAPSLVPVGRR